MWIKNLKTCANRGRVAETKVISTKRQNTQSINTGGTLLIAASRNSLKRKV